MAEATAQKKKSGNKIARFFKELKSELKKVVWPSKKHVSKNTLIVIVAVLIIGAIIYGLDLFFGWGMSKIITR